MPTDPLKATSEQIDGCNVEEWRPIPSLGGFYAASNFGRVMRVTGSTSGRILKTPPNAGGYLRFYPSLYGVCEPKSVHSAVCEAFIGPRPTGMDINHKDGVRTNNRSENLEYMTRQQNHMHAAVVLGSVCGENSPRAKIKAADVLLIRSEWAAGNRSPLWKKDLASRIGISVGHLEKIVTRRTWKYLHPDSAATIRTDTAPHAGGE